MGDTTKQARPTKAAKKPKAPSKWDREFEELKRLCPAIQASNELREAIALGSYWLKKFLSGEIKELTPELKWAIELAVRKAPTPFEAEGPGETLWEQQKRKEAEQGKEVEKSAGEGRRTLQ